MYGSLAIGQRALSLSRWMYRGHRPNWLAMQLNRISAVVHRLGVAPNYMVTLEVIGRTSGKTIRLPLVMAIVDGRRYLVSMLGEDVAWVRNVRAAGGDVVLLHGRREAVHLEEVSADLRAPILKAFLSRAPGARPHIPLDKDAPLPKFAEIAAGYPVFSVETRRE